MAVRLNIKDSPPQSFSGDRNKFKAIEEPRMSPIIKRLETICQPITDRDVIAGVDGLDQESDKLNSCPSTEFYFIGYDSWRHLNLHQFGGTEARRYTTLKSILTPDWGHQNLSAGQLIKQYTNWFNLFKSMKHKQEKPSTMTSRLQQSSIKPRVR
eukprot:4132205-Amphidinium_carterae.1